MARFSETQPEENEWATALRHGPVASEQPLLRLVNRMEREGDSEDQYSALSKLLSHYCHHGEREKALSVVQRLEALDISEAEDCEWWDLSTARALIFGLQEYERAVPYIERDLDRLGPDQQLARRCHYGAWLLGLKLVTQVERNAAPEEAATTIRQLGDLLGVGFPHAEVLPSIRKLVESGQPGSDVEWVLMKMWAELAMQYKFHGFGDRETLSAIEELLLQLGVSPKNRI
jgi:hypothetical protein